MTVVRLGMALLAGAAAGVVVRVVGALALNGSLNGPQFEHLLFHSTVLPKFFLFFLAAFVVIGAPVFLWARKRQLFSWPLFAVTGAVAGYLSVYPLWFVPSWAAVHTAAGLLASLVAYGVLSAGQRSRVAL